MPNLGVDWNTPHMVENAGQASSYSRAQHSAIFRYARNIGAEYCRFPHQFTYHFRTPTTIYDPGFIEFMYSACLGAGCLPCVILNACPDTSVNSWNALLPADGRYRHGNKPEDEHLPYILAQWRESMQILRSVARRFGVPPELIAVQTGNEVGKGGVCDWRPYAEQLPANPEELSADGVVPASIVSYTASLLDIVKSSGFMAISPAMEAETTTILSAELASIGWTAVQNAHDKVALHSYPATGTARGRMLAQRLSRTAYSARTAVMSGITKPIWLTETGSLQADSKPTGEYIAASMALAAKYVGTKPAERVFAFALCMNDNLYAAIDKTVFAA